MHYVGDQCLQDFFLLQVCYVKALKVFGHGGIEAEDLSIKVQFPLQGTPDSIAAPEAVLLPLKHDQCCGDALALNCVVHDLGLIGRHHLILCALTNNKRI